ncbi:hypothetical protein FHT70_002049 [Rhizobium sp. BK049]|nr:hypothetical protein [Rhizobium sp. BK049]
MQAPERRFERLQQFLAKSSAGLDRKVGILRNIGNAVEIGDFGMEEIAKKKFCDSRTRPRSSRPFIEPGFRMSFSSSTSAAG